MNKFPQHVIEKLGWYVYALQDPRSKRIFYIGKGMGNRVFAHANSLLSKHEIKVSDKLDIISEIINSGQTVTAIIIRHQIPSEKDAYAIESSLIDFCDSSDRNSINPIFQLTNMVKGHGNQELGLMTAENVIQIYHAPKCPTIKEKGIEWYSIMRRVDIKEIDTQKIIFYDVGMLPNFMIDTDNHIFGGGTSHSFRLSDNTFTDKYILGILNSKLMQWVIYDLCPVKMGNARKYGLDYIKKLPISEGDSEIQNQMQILVDKVISTKKELADTTEIETQIDQLVYKLYDLTEEEIKIIEGE